MLNLLTLPDRVAYLKTSLPLTQPQYMPLRMSWLPAVLDAVYGKLLSFDITAASFVPRNTAVYLWQ